MRKEEDIHHRIIPTFIDVIGLVGGFTLAIQIARRGNISENWDKVIYLSAILIGSFYILLYRSNLMRLLSRASTALALIALVVIALGIGGVETHDSIASQMALSNYLWLGFGPLVLILSISILPIVWKITNLDNVRFKSSKIPILIAALFTLLCALSFFQTEKTIIDPYHTGFIINEIYASLAGNFPYVDYVPQYQIFYTFSTHLLSTFVGSEYLLNGALILFSLFALLSIGLGVWLGKLCLPQKSWLLAFFLIVPLVSVTPFPSRLGFSGSIAALVSGLPVRILPGIIICLFSYKILEEINGHRRYTKVFLLGIFAGINVWNSQDFGVGIIVATAVTFLFISIASVRVRLRLTLVFLIGTALGLISYFFLIRIFTDKKVDLGYVGFYLKQFGAGHGAEPIYSPGPVLLVLPLLVALVVVHFLVSKLSRDVHESIREILLRNSFAGFQLATWSVIGFNYYLNRSFASGQLQILFLPLSVSFVCFIGSLMYLNSCGHSNAIGMKIEDPIFTKRQSFRLAKIVFLLILSSFVASSVMLPNPRIEVSRLSSGNEVAKANAKSIEEIQKYIIKAQEFADSQQMSLGYFGLFANYFEFQTKVDSLSLLSTPADVFLSDEALQKSCLFLNSKGPDIIFLGPEALGVLEKTNMKLCDSYIVFDVEGLPRSALAKRI